MLESSDHQLLDTLGKPKRIDLRLVRQLKYYKEPSLVLTRVGHSQEPLIDSSTVTSAVWWVPPKDGLHGSHERRLEGEIHLPPNLQPSSNFLLFSVEYTVVLYPFLSGSFVPAASGHEPLIKQVVKVATFRCEGPEPRSFTQARAVKSLELGDTGKSKQTDPLQGAPDVSWFGPTPMSPWG
ncbi:hypothetical protein BDN72DRAFT_844637 [Pluteus cervinus]|uniref:Uncharacterized protein n=1 Tax=Pluteus cervinus TaxID=181527 RepID=A0ACD3AKU9_9AGAR|nr:hypothetical protein BDN72DRAFT_844637 [Pluteus cervinus]